MFKIGDHVRSKRWGVDGLIKDIKPCNGHYRCPFSSLTIDDPGFPGPIYYHTNDFVVILKGDEATSG